MEIITEKYTKTKHGRSQTLKAIVPWIKITAIIKQSEREITNKKWPEKYLILMNCLVPSVVLFWQVFDQSFLLPLFESENLPLEKLYKLLVCFDTKLASCLGKCLAPE